MLKRNGETCQHAVPDFPGLLTGSEKTAYLEALSSVERLLTEFNEGATALADIERQISKQAGKDSIPPAEDTLTIRSADGDWQIHKTLHRSPQNELLLCSRPTDQGAQFGILEQFAPGSIYAQMRGGTDVQMTGNQASLLLQDYVEQERQVLQLFRQDIAATVEETLAEKYPGEDYSRVVKAISARCGAKAAVKNEKPLAQKQARSARIRF